MKSPIILMFLDRDIPLPSADVVALLHARTATIPSVDEIGEFYQISRCNKEHHHGLQGGTTSLALTEADWPPRDVAALIRLSACCPKKLDKTTPPTPWPTCATLRVFYQLRPSAYRKACATCNSVPGSSRRRLVLHAQQRAIYSLIEQFPQPFVLSSSLFYHALKRQ